MNFKKVSQIKISPMQFFAYIALLLIVIAIISMVYLNKLEKELEMKRSLGLNITTSVVKGDTAEIRYFATSSNATIIARYPKGNNEAINFLLSDIEEFKKQAKENLDARLNSGATSKSDKEMMLKDFQSQYVATYATSTSSSTSSVILMIYNYTGGAHGTKYYHVINYDNNKNVISNQDILSKYDINKISKESFSQVKNEYYKLSQSTSTIEDFYKSPDQDYALKWITEGTAATTTNYSVMWEDGENLMVYIGQYQVWPYVYGDITLSIPSSKVLK